MRFLACLALYGLAARRRGRQGRGRRAGLRLARPRFLADAPLFLAYKKIRLDWFPAEAILRSGGMRRGSGMADSPRSAGPALDDIVVLDHGDDGRDAALRPRPPAARPVRRGAAASS